MGEEAETTYDGSETVGFQPPSQDHIEEVIDLRRILDLRKPGVYTVKRLRRGPDCVWLEPANARYQSVRVAEGEELHVFGVVKHSIHSLR